MSKDRLQKLISLCNHTLDQTRFPAALADLTHRHTTINSTHHPTSETKLYKLHKPQPQEDINGTWPIPDTLYDALHQCFNIQIVIHCNPINLPLRAKTYISHDTKDTRFGAIPYTPTAWPGKSLSLPDYTPSKLRQALEHAIYSAHAYIHTSPSSHILLLPDWEHSPYLARKLHTSYAQKIASIPYHPLRNKPPNISKPKLNVCLVACEKALALLNHLEITNTLREAITKLAGQKTPSITLNIHKKDP
jgi:hypothetical protein